MSEHNKTVEPVRFEPASGPATEPSEQPARSRSAARPGAAGTEKWIVPALAGLVLVALLVFFWLPSQVNNRPVELDTASETSASATVNPDRISVLSISGMGRVSDAGRKLSDRFLANPV